MAKSLVIYAINVHEGGGKKLLIELIRAIPNELQITLFLDARVDLGFVPNYFQVKRIKPSLLSRFSAELVLYWRVRKSDLVLCFGNLPPIFKLSGYTILFLQNRFLVDRVSLESIPIKTRIRIHLERLWVSLRITNIDAVIVQTPSMKRLVKNLIKSKLIPIKILPFLGGENKVACSVGNLSEDISSKVFLYVASGWQHKNHKTLIEAWCLLADEGIYPCLHLTINPTKFPALINEQNELAQTKGLNINNWGELDGDGIRRLYVQSSALIFPSLVESLGLPLLEARLVGLDVIASELDFVRDVLNPVESFNPLSAISIARAVKRYLGISEESLPLISPREFINSIMSLNEVND